VTIVAGGLGVMLLIWFVMGHVRHTRKARVLAQLSAQYQERQHQERQYRKQLAISLSDITTASVAVRITPAVTSVEPGQKITVDELVARIKAEDLSVRLRRDDRDEADERHPA